MEESKSKNIKTIFNFNTKYCSDSIEWCPHDPNKTKFTCANYQLEDDGKEKRFGRILFFSLTPNGLNLCQTINTSAVLDQKWCHKQVNGFSLLGVVNAKSTLEIYELKETFLQLLCSYTFEITGKENLILSLDWSTGISSFTEPEIVCSDSQGKIHLLKLNKERNLILINSWHQHEFEAWITAFYYWDTNIFFSGGDDCLFLQYDKRLQGDCASVKNKSHTAGVTSMHSHYSKEYYLATGSYDEYVRFWDIRRMKNEISSLKMPGTLWRLKWEPFHQNYLLAACMAGGVHVIKHDDAENKEVIASYLEHQSLAYGVDWSYLDKDCCDFISNKDEFVIGSCSFYDHLLCVSKAIF